MHVKLRCLVSSIDACLIMLDCRDAPEDGLTFTFRFTDATISISNQGNNQSS